MKRLYRSTEIQIRNPNPALSPSAALCPKQYFRSVLVCLPKRQKSTLIFLFICFWFQRLRRHLSTSLKCQEWVQQSPLHLIKCVTYTVKTDYSFKWCIISSAISGQNVLVAGSVTNRHVPAVRLSQVEELKRGGSLNDPYFSCTCVCVCFCARACVTSWDCIPAWENQWDQCNREQSISICTHAQARTNTPMSPTRILFSHIDTHTHTHTYFCTHTVHSAQARSPPHSLHAV